VIYFIAQSVYRLATGWTAEGSEFESLQGQDVSLLHSVQTVSGNHSASYPVGTGAWSWPLTSNHRRGQEYVDLYIHSPIRLHGVVLNIVKHRDITFTQYLDCVASNGEMADKWERIWKEPIPMFFYSDWEKPPKTSSRITVSLSRFEIRTKQAPNTNLGTAKPSCLVRYSTS
jgi:hypothetical protein